MSRARCWLAGSRSWPSPSLRRAALTTAPGHPTSPGRRASGSPSRASASASSAASRPEVPRPRSNGGWSDAPLEEAAVGALVGRLEPERRELAIDVGFVRLPDLGVADALESPVNELRGVGGVRAPEHVERRRVRSEERRVGIECTDRGMLWTEIII